MSARKLSLRLVFFILLFFCFFFSFSNSSIAQVKIKKPEKVLVGLYLNNVGSINLQENIFMADFYLWFKWKGKIDPTKSYEFTNSYERWAFSYTPAFDQPKSIGDGWLYQVYRIEGKFICKYDLHSYPLDIQHLTIELEDGKHHSGELLYELDNQESSYNDKIIIPGWKVIKQFASAFEHDYDTSFGLPENLSNHEKYNRFKFTMSISRPQLLFLFKTILPIIIVLTCVFTVFFINPIYFDVRTTITITALLSAVALQITSSADMPAVGYMVLIDKIYNLTYLITLLTLIETVICSRLNDRSQLEKALKLDKRIFIILSVFTTLSFLFIIFSG